MTPDAVGPLAADTVLATRHLKERLPQDFAAFSRVCVPCAPASSAPPAWRAPSC